MTTKISGKKRKKSNRSICPGIVHPRPVMTFRALNTFSGHPLPDVTIKSEEVTSASRAVDMLCEENEAIPEHAPMQLAKALSFLEKRSRSSRMCFEEALLLHLHRVFRPLLTRCSTNVQMAFSRRQSSTRNPDRN